MCFLKSEMHTGRTKSLFWFLCSLEGEIRCEIQRSKVKGYKKQNVVPSACSASFKSLNRIKWCTANLVSFTFDLLTLTTSIAHLKLWQMKKKTLNRLCWCSHCQRIRHQVCCNTSCVSTTPKSVHLKIAKIKSAIESIAERFWCSFPRRIISDVRRKVSWTQQMHFVKKLKNVAFILPKKLSWKSSRCDSAVSFTTGKMSFAFGTTPPAPVVKE